jgi:hypothetical protein
MAERPLDQTWREVEAYVEDMFFTQLTEQIAGFADALGLQIEADIRRGLERFFAELSTLINGLEAAPEWVTDNDGTWEELSASYLKFKNPKVNSSRDYRNNFFVLSELARIKRNSKKSRALRRRQMVSAAQLRKNPSLRMQIARLGNVADYFGDVSVSIESHTRINRGGRRQYKAGTFRGDVNMGGKQIKFNSDFVTLTVKWLPALDGLDVLERGVTEDAANHGAKVGGLRPLPADVRKKLMNHEYNNYGTAYRPLLGPYMLWYQDTQVREMIRKSVAQYGPQL